MRDFFWGGPHNKDNVFFGVYNGVPVCMETTTSRIHFLSMTNPTTSLDTLHSPYWMLPGNEGMWVIRTLMRETSFAVSHERKDST